MATIITLTTKEKVKEGEEEVAEAEGEEKGADDEEEDEEEQEEEAAAEQEEEEEAAEEEEEQEAAEEEEREEEEEEEAGFVPELSRRLIMAPLALLSSRASFGTIPTENGLRDAVENIWEATPRRWMRREHTANMSRMASFLSRKRHLSTRASTG